MERGLRGGLLVVALLSAALGAGYYLQLPWAVQTWPWAETRLSNIFIASILGAVAGAMLWVAVSGRLAGAAGGFVHVGTMAFGLGAVMTAQAAQGAIPTGYAAPFAAAGALSVAGFAWVRRLPVRDTRPLPRSLRLWAVLYIAILLPAGTALLFVVPGVMPWPVRPAMSMVCGCVFVSAAWSFAYPLLRPQVEHVRVGLVGFLAYDAVLALPFIELLDKVRPELLRSLQLYLLALAVTAAVSLYYLFICRATR